jgi:hypothetical protein
MAVQLMKFGADFAVNNSGTCGFRIILTVNSVNQLIFVMVKCCVFFAVRTEFLNIVLTSFSFEMLKTTQLHWLLTVQTNQTTAF